MAEREVGCWPFDELSIYDGLRETNATSTPQATAPALALAQKDEDLIMGLLFEVFLLIL